MVNFKTRKRHLLASPHWDQLCGQKVCILEAAMFFTGSCICLNRKIGSFKPSSQLRGPKRCLSQTLSRNLTKKAPGDWSSPDILLDGLLLHAYPETRGCGLVSNGQMPWAEPGWVSSGEGGPLAFSGILSGGQWSCWKGLKTDLGCMQSLCICVSWNVFREEQFRWRRQSISPPPPRNTRLTCGIRRHKVKG